MAEKVPLTDPTQQALFAPIEGQYDRTHVDHPSGYGTVQTVQGAVSSKHNYGEIGTGKARSEWGITPGDTHPSRSIAVSIPLGHTRLRVVERLQFGRHKMGAARGIAAEQSATLGENRREAFGRAVRAVGDTFIGNGPEGDDFVPGGRIIEHGRDERLTRGLFSRSSFAQGVRLVRATREATYTGGRWETAGRWAGAISLIGAVAPASLAADIPRVIRRGIGHLGRGGSFFRSGH